jgi:murein L,D-transpeptidase YafK
MSCRIVINKAARKLELFRDGRLAASHSVALGRNGAADKAVEGDEATPVGEFYVCAKNPRSKFFLSLCLSYPNAEDAERGLATGLITPGEHAQILAAILGRKMPPQHTRLGGEIYIHGQPPAPPGPKDWTRGCIAVDNQAMQSLYDCVELGTPVVIE